ncbi:sugar transporter [Cryptococcus neoformans]|uniref:Sugar transporter n=3 Tax=Cryptococcus neoformans TaxID=5207 RepID=A0A854QGW4_CRYNE|nr:sugar transporter [Cryptococcus neoformans var. grubii H99]AUB28233.1 sugar transporter [Cryptococcus neoformans var. grubii]OWT37148.1 sugar transporter [Cryptococcus neoformans var. grubii Bt1]OWZ30365.1 sugar transporter [Cryptococcus neoformans var. grubii AD1-83a]OWZ33829.1 sugar transporter [Cryptococcus neoformans var. grubii AD2-60a]OWZ45957.1 sugar transporter [Cryptococcus neoformans var. grubii C23]OWZ56160.1 sugar transporter [Cryptococcus neoformans var. grubii 125.91]OXC8181|eukprot:XP_012052504.1 sugar transporter [Cryptococcus neoformans var. grubii H99]
MVGFGSKSLRKEAMQASMVPTSDSERRPWHAHSRSYLLASVGFLGIFLFGYDTGLGGGVIALSSFSKSFNITGTKDQIADLQGNIVAILQGGAFFGAIIAAWVNDWLGRKYSLMVGCWIFIIGACIQTAASSQLSWVYGGRFTSGFGVGLMSAVCPTYASEIAPKEIRGRITGMFQVIVVIGVAFSYWINYGVTFMDQNRGNIVWRIPIGFQLVPVGFMVMLLPLLKESPRWLATKHKDERALANLAWIRKLPVTDQSVQLEYAEIAAAIKEEEEATKGSSWREVFAKGNPIRFVIAFVVFTLQQWSGQNSISYYAPIIFQSIGIRGSKSGLLASGIYGIVKIIATATFIAFGIERFGRKKPLLLGVGLMSMFLWIIGAIFNTHLPDKDATTTSGASIAMAVMIYLFVIPYCFSVGPLPWVICSEIFNNRTRHYGLMTAAATQWLWNFAVTKATPLMVIHMPKGGIFFFFAAINIISFCLALLLPETSGVSLESMDVIFGAVTKEEREAEIARRAVELEGRTFDDEEKPGAEHHEHMDEKEKERI